MTAESGFDPRTFVYVLLEDAIIYFGGDRTNWSHSGMILVGEN